MNFLSDQALKRLRDGAEMPDLAGTRYRLLERIARGGMGVVYAAEDENLRRRVALKVLDVPGTDGDLRNRLIREARVLAALEHPGIVPVHDVGTLADGRVFYTMKFVEGNRLDKFIESVTSVPDRLRLFLRICDAVAFAHARGVLHRDLKPANIMVGPFGEVLVMDWGLAKILRGEVSSSMLEADPEATVFDNRNRRAVRWNTWMRAAIFIRSVHCCDSYSPANRKERPFQVHRAWINRCGPFAPRRPRRLRWSAIGTFRRWRWMFQDTWTGWRSAPIGRAFSTGPGAFTGATGSLSC